VTLRDNVVIFLQPEQFNSLTSFSPLRTGKESWLINGGTATFINMEVFSDNSSVVTTAVLNGFYMYAIKGDSIFWQKQMAA
jgi:hypothetical protein